MSTKYEKLIKKLGIFAKKLDNTHRIASLLNKFCKNNIDNDVLYEVSYAAELIENELVKLGYDIYAMTNEQNDNMSLEDIIKNNITELRH